MGTPGLHEACVGSIERRCGNSSTCPGFRFRVERWSLAAEGHGNKDFRV